MVFSFDSILSNLSWILYDTNDNIVAVAKIFVNGFSGGIGTELLEYIRKNWRNGTLIICYKQFIIFDNKLLIFFFHTLLFTVEHTVQVVHLVRAHLQSDLPYDHKRFGMKYEYFLGYNDRDYLLFYKLDLLLLYGALDRVP